MATTSWLLATFGETGSFGGLALVSGLDEGRNNRVVTEEMSFHFSRCGSRTLHITKYDTDGEVSFGGALTLVNLVFKSAPNINCACFRLRHQYQN
jgi:hypothetical protein